MKKITLPSTIETSIESDSPSFRASFLAFTNEATRYCHDISDDAAREFAMGYLGLLHHRAQGIDRPCPHHPDLSKLNQELICASLERIYHKHLAPDEPPSEQ